MREAGALSSAAGLAGPDRGPGGGPASLLRRDRPPERCSRLLCCMASTLCTAAPPHSRSAGDARPIPLSGELKRGQQRDMRVVVRVQSGAPLHSVQWEARGNDGWTCGTGSLPAAAMLPAAALPATQLNHAAASECCRRQAREFGGLWVGMRNRKPTAGVSGLLSRQGSQQHATNCACRRRARHQDAGSTLPFENQVDISRQGQTAKPVVTKQCHTPAAAGACSRAGLPAAPKPELELADC